MKNKGNLSIILIIIVALIIGALIYFKSNKEIFTLFRQETTPATQEQKKNTLEEQLQSYSSQDLKISFKYPKAWYIDDEYPFVLISNFKSSLHQDVEVKDNQVEVFIKEFSGCFPTLEEDLIDPACGQGKQKNKIISKEVNETPDGEFLKYTLDSHDENQRIQYFFQKGNRILDIEKRPDPSQFEEEFEEIVNSIKFL
jgi:uncharacterized protein YxeA